MVGRRGGGEERGTGGPDERRGGGGTYCHLYAANQTTQSHPDQIRQNGWAAGRVGNQGARKRMNGRKEDEWRKEGGFPREKEELLSLLCLEPSSRARGFQVRKVRERSSSSLKFLPPPPSCTTASPLFFRPPGSRSSLLPPLRPTISSFSFLSTLTCLVLIHAFPVAEWELA